MARERAGQRVTIGFAGIADFRSIIGQEYIAGITAAASDYGVNLINFAGAIKYSLSGDIDFFQHYSKKYRFMRPNVIDGLVTWASSLNVYLAYDGIRALHEKLKPLPLVDLGVPILADVPGVTIDPAEGLALIMNHLCRVHHYRKIGFVGCSDGRQYQDRLAAWRQELTKHGLEEDPRSVGILDSLEAKDIHRWVDQLCQQFELREKRELEALVTVSDVSAAILVEALQSRGIRVPRDLAVTGYNNQTQSMGASCPITTVDLGYYKRGYAAVELLLDRIEQPDRLFETMILPSHLVVRQSCGCFEVGVMEAADGNLHGLLEGNWGGDRFLNGSQLVSIFPELSPGRLESLADALWSDFGKPQNQAFLRWIQESLAWEHSKVPDRMAFYQDLVSRVRGVLSDFFVDDAERRLWEDRLHQARVLISLATLYYEKSHQTDAYRFNNLARIAISFASARTLSEILDAIRYHMGELEMPGILMVLQDEASNDLGAGHLEFVHPPSEVPESPLPLRIHESNFIPRSFFPKDRPWVMMFQVLSVSGNFLGYTLMEMGPLNVALYDAVRTLLSHSLYAVYAREGRNARWRDRLLTSEKVSSLLSSAGDAKGRSSLDAHRVIAYLTDHLAYPTDLDAMSLDLSVSKSYLIRRTKALTGHTVQALHELLKVERAKLLLESRNLKIGDVASQLGYQSQSYFSTVFKKNTGVGPREWMQRRENS